MKQLAASIKLIEAWKMTIIKDYPLQLVKTMLTVLKLVERSGPEQAECGMRTAGHEQPKKALAGTLPNSGTWLPLQSKMNSL